MAKLVVQGILTNYEQIGSGKKMLVILHGWQQSLNEWLPIAQGLQKEYTILLFDLPGFGTTPRPKQSWDIYEYAHFVELCLEKLDIKKYSLVGHSFGGRISIILASKSDQIEKLILIDSAGLEKKTLITTLKIVLSRLFAFLLPELTREQLRAILGSDDYQTAGNMRDIFKKVVRQDLRHLLSKITAPTCIIWGDRDEQVPVTQTKIYHTCIKNSRVRIVWDCGHNPHLENPHELLTILQENL